MKKQRFLYLAGVVGVVGFVMGVLFFVVFSEELEDPVEMAVSTNVAVGSKQMMPDERWITAVSAQIEALEYAISLDDNATQIAYQAPNRAQNLRTSFSESGIQVEPRLAQGDAWESGLELIGLNNGLQTIAPALAAHTTVENRVTMDYGQWQAWYINDTRGVEQGFTIEEPLFAHETGLIQIDMAVTGDLTPQLVNDDEVGLVTAVGEQILSYYGLTAFDAHGEELSAAMDVVALADGQTGIRLAVDVAEAEYPIVVDPFLGGGPDWEGWIDQDANYGFSVSTAGDVNGDGFDDVLVGAHWFDGSTPNTGAVFAYYGSPDGLPPMFQWMVEGDMPDMELGYQVNPAGDVNQDGFADIIIGTNMTPTGYAYVYTGTLAGLSNQPQWVGFGEQDGDGFGTAVNTAGDVNNDDVDDIIIGAPYFDGAAGSDSGRAYVFYGPISSAVQSPDWIGEGGEIEYYADGLFGYSVSTAGDVNGDDFDDVIIGEPFGRSEVIQGRALIYTGTLSGLFMPGSGEPAGIYDAAWMSDGPDWGNSEYGASVSVAGDVNGDGFSDVVVGAPQYSDIVPTGGAVFVYTGTHPIINMSTFEDPNWTVYSNIPDAMLGYDVGMAGDVDLDGYDDVIMGAPQFDNTIIPESENALNGGGAFVYRGSPFGFDSVWEFSSDVANAKLGTSVGTAGDVNGDGYADVIIGAPEMPSPNSTLGEAFSFYGSGAISGLQAFNDSPTNLGEPTLLWTEIDTGGVLDYAWDLGDGALFYGPQAAYVYPQPGYYTAIVTATSLTDQMTATTAVTVSASSLIPPSGGELNFFNEETGFGTGIYIPPGAVSGTFKLSYTPVSTPTQPSPENSIGYYFDLNTDVPDHQVFLPIIVSGDDGEGGTAVPNSFARESVNNSYEFNVPITMTIVYTDTGLTEAEELNLKLPYWNTDQQAWIDIAEECDLSHTYMYYPDDNYFTVQVCHLSRMSVAH